MRPHTLATLLVFVLLWDVGPLLATSWQPRARATAGAQEFFPLALRYREQIWQVSSFGDCLRHHRSAKPASLRPAGHPVTTTQPIAPNLFSRLMPLRC